MPPRRRKKKTELPYRGVDNDRAKKRPLSEILVRAPDKAGKDPRSRKERRELLGNGAWHRKRVEGKTDEGMAVHSTSFTRTPLGRRRRERRAKNKAARAARRRNRS